MRSILIASLWIAASPGPARAGEPSEATPAPAALLECHDKAYPNLPGESSIAVRKEKSGQYVAMAQSYDKPKIYKRLKCQLHRSESGVFTCRQGSALGVQSRRVTERSIDTDGHEASFDGYVIEVVKNPLGEPDTVLTLRFAKDRCQTASAAP
jgi:hypothetical protein